MNLDTLTDYEKVILFAARNFNTTLIRSANGERIPAPVHRKATLKLEKMGCFEKSDRIQVTKEVMHWVDQNHMSIPTGKYQIL